MILLLLLLAGYIYPLYRCIKFDRAYYGPNGVGSDEKPTLREFIIAFIPIFNIIYVCIMYIENESPWKSSYHRELERIKKEKPLHPILKLYFKKDK
jgi:hypothetical protein